VPSPQSAQKAPAHPLWLRTQQLAQYPGMPLLLRAHSGAAGLGLLHVYVPVRCLLGGDRRKNRVRAEPPSYAGDNTAAPGRSTFSDGLSGGSQSIFPKRNMSFLHLGEVRVDFGDLWIGLALCHSSVLGSAVNFVLPIFPIAFDISSLQHIFILSKCDTDVSARPLARASLRNPKLFRNAPPAIDKLWIFLQFECVTLPKLSVSLGKRKMSPDA